MDGSVIAFMPSTTIALRAAVAAFPFDPEKDLAPITTAGTFETALAVSPRAGVTSVRTFALWARDGEPERRRIGVTVTDSLLQVYARTIGRAIDGDRRLAAAPDVPTANELGFPGMLTEEWYGFFASAAAPPATVAEWNRQIGAVLAEREVATTLAKNGLQIVGSTPQQAADRVRAHLESWRTRMAAFKLEPLN
ncbi:MAG: hypothetical protein J0J01_15680 [Reyranella sp.]|uniref:tripartite tricarboxylate transporter substrate-binding protein n=1 Tax=Reyranella sp. TaxID=1929291 RepID=UPI001AC39663|nr:tripartite tricarboxylate transporter substrate-binding protein [Reyranella sp.]MBN9088345.1 hypothetical protein [Reyranella sp.]